MRNFQRALVAVTVATGSLTVAAPPAAACTDDNEVCAAINLVCQTALGRPCLR